MAMIVQVQFPCQYRRCFQKKRVFVLSRKIRLPRVWLAIRLPSVVVISATLMWTLTVVPHRVLGKTGPKTGPVLQTGIQITLRCWALLVIVKLVGRAWIVQLKLLTRSRCRRQQLHVPWVVLIVTTLREKRV